ncbi:MAG: hypothetical protein Q9174_002048 [Haloplaca sp. 1 TL-2023]
MDSQGREPVSQRGKFTIVTKEADPGRNDNSRPDGFYEKRYQTIVVSDYLASTSMLSPSPASATCQKAHWPTHKTSCAATAKHNCYLVRATPPPSSNIGPSSSEAQIASLIEPFQLKHYGDEHAEMTELKSRLGWSSVYEVAKFYDHKGTDTWYHFVYGDLDAKKQGKPKNEAISRASHHGKDVFGDVVVIRSGPGEGPNEAQQVFTKGWLEKSLEFNKTRDAKSVFAERERSRFQRKMGM